MNALTKISAIVGASAFAGIFVWGIIFQVLLRVGIIQDRTRVEPYVKVGVFALFMVFGLCCMPLLMRVFIGGQGAIGNNDVGMVRFLREHFVGVTIGFWGFLLLGMAIALPVMWTQFFGFGAGKTNVGKSEGILRANVGMTFEEIAGASTLKMAEPIGPGIAGARQCVGKCVFDFEISGTGMRFEQCRYYFLETGGKGDPHVSSMNIGISPSKTNKPETDAVLAKIHQELGADGWRVGYFVYRTRLSQVLHGKVTSERDERYWAKDHTLLIVSTRRMDDEVAGEDKQTAGEFIVVLEISALEKAKHADLQFEPPEEGIQLIP